MRDESSAVAHGSSFEHRKRLCVPLRARALPAQSLLWGEAGRSRAARRATTVARGTQPPSERLYRMVAMRASQSLPVRLRRQTYSWRDGDPSRAWVVSSPTT